MLEKFWFLAPACSDRHGESQPYSSRTRIQPALIRQESLERNQVEEPITIKIKKGLCMKHIKTDLHRGGLLAVASVKEGDI